MTLLDDALERSGGLDRWRSLRRLTVHLSIEGMLFRRRCGLAMMKDMVVEGDTHERALEITGFTAPDRRALYRPDHVALERSDGTLLEERRDATDEFRRRLTGGTWDDLLLTFYCGSLIRSYLDVPFVLADADVIVNEDTRQRALQVQFPKRLAAHAEETTLYFDSLAQIQRQNYAALHEHGTSIEQIYSGYQRYSGILIPTLCRLLQMNKHEAGTTASSVLVEIEIFDAAFE
jgi:hypothetical protein